MRLISIMLFIIATYSNSFATAQPPMLNFVKSVDWTFMGDKTEFSLDLCSCTVNKILAAGFKAKIAEPIGLIESTNTPWNVVSLGMKFGKKGSLKKGNSNNDSNNRRYAHFIAFAPLGMLNFVQDYVCFERLSSASFLYWSEIIPTQTNDIFALFVQGSKGPFSKIWFNNPLAGLACVADCAAATFDYSINSLHWCAGCSGVTGNNTAYGGGKSSNPIVQAHAQGLGMIDDLHFAGALSKISNGIFAYSPTKMVSDSRCSAKYFPLAIKTQYRMQLAYPSVWSPTIIGKNPALWAEFKNTPTSGDDNSFWLWTIKDTCVGASKCVSMFTMSSN